ncbi:hypothetical protein [Shewanella bicestrii]|uniref:hypothetical protein n=1 Tax=Shewanella bicestrii TaxID=2018305 RepID=UPI0012FE3ECE|nr:hypothetical protein [Shewanella bicestrii]
MPPTVTVVTVAILTTIELFIWLKAFCPISRFRLLWLDQVFVMNKFEVLEMNVSASFDFKGEVFYLNAYFSRNGASL